MRYRHRYSLRLAQVCIKSFLELLHAFVFSHICTVKALFMLRIVMPFHVITFQISNAFSAYQTHRFLVKSAIAKEVLMLPGIVKRALSGITKTTFFLSMYAIVLRFTNSMLAVSKMTLLSDVSSGFLGIERYINSSAA